MKIYPDIMISLVSDEIISTWVDTTNGSENLAEAILEFLIEFDDTVKEDFNSVEGNINDLDITNYSDKWIISYADDLGGEDIIDRDEKDLEKICTIGEAISEHGDAMIAFLNLYGYHDISMFDDCYRGQSESVTKFAETWLSENYPTIPFELLGCIDMERVSDTFLADHDAIQINGMVYFFQDV